MQYIVCELYKLHEIRQNAGHTERWPEKKRENVDFNTLAKTVFNGGLF
jgi:hypothetical protein